MKASIPGRLSDPVVRLRGADKKRLQRARQAPAGGERAPSGHPLEGNARGWSNDELPVGTVRVWRGQVRMVKVRLEGPAPRRWAIFARWWWEKNRGPVPRGKRVLHRDGNPLNDDPGNLFLGTAADSVALWHVLHPAESEKQLRRCHAGAAAHNRLRAEVARLLGWLRDAWYPVDFEKRQVLNDPKLKMWEVYATHLPGTAKKPDVRRIISWALGWPGSPALAACAFAVLAEARDGLRLEELLRRANDLGARYGRPPSGVNGLFQVVQEQPYRSWLVSRRRGRRRLYTIHPCALEGRLAPCRVVAVPSALLQTEAFLGFEKVRADGRRYDRRRMDEQSLLELAGVKV